MKLLNILNIINSNQTKNIFDEKSYNSSEGTDVKKTSQQPSNDDKCSGCCCQRFSSNEKQKTTCTLIWFVNRWPIVDHLVLINTLHLFWDSLLKIFESNYHNQSNENITDRPCTKFQFHSKSLCFFPYLNNRNACGEANQTEIWNETRRIFR